MPAIQQKTLFLSALAIGCAVSFMAGKIYYKPDGSEPSQGAQNREHSSEKLKGAQSLSPRNHHTNRAPSDGHRVSPRYGSTGSPIERLNATQGIDKPSEQAEAVLQLAKQLSPSQLEEVIAHLQAAGEKLDSRSIYYPLIDAWVRTDPQAALNHAQEYIAHQATRKMMISTWALAEPTKALDWARKQDALAEQYSWTAGVATALAEVNLKMATEIVTGMPNSASRNAALHTLVVESMLRGDEAASKWIHSIKDEELKARALRYLAINQGRKS